MSENRACGECGLIVPGALIDEANSRWAEKNKPRYISLLRASACPRCAGQGHFANLREYDITDGSGYGLLWSAKHWGAASYPAKQKRILTIASRLRAYSEGIEGKYDLFTVPEELRHLTYKDRRVKRVR